MDSVYYHKCIIIPFLKIDVISFYPNNLYCLKFQQDKATSHTFASTALYFEK